MKAKRLPGHNRIWWLHDDLGKCQPTDIASSVAENDSATWGRMLAILDYTDANRRPPSNKKQYNPLGDGLAEFKVSHPDILRLYVATTERDWLIVYGSTSKDSQDRDIRHSREIIKKLENLKLKKEEITYE